MDTVTSKDAAMFPIIASCALFGLYLIFMIFSKEYINLLLSSYFFFLGIYAMTQVFSPFVTSLVPSIVPFHTYTLVMTCTSPPSKKQDKTEGQEKLLNLAFSTHDCVCVALCSLIGLWYIIKKVRDTAFFSKGNSCYLELDYNCYWYIIKKHWVANNLLGLAFAVNGIELLSLNSVTTGALLLAGLFVYDIFWVFGTNVMVTVARSFEAPIK
ncbi:hypothetical protein HAZT_HAZT001573, partial [Hyalella azteca]